MSMKMGSFSGGSKSFSYQRIFSENNHFLVNQDFNTWEKYVVLNKYLFTGPVGAMDPSSQVIWSLLESSGLKSTLI